MNGEPLPLDHGRPVRLAVPGWYGCAWIKWVNEIRLVGAGRTGDQPDEGVRRPHPSVGAPRSRARLRRPGNQAAAVPDPRRTAPHCHRHRIPHRRHRLGRPPACRSPGDPLWRRWSVDAVFDLSRSGLVCHVVALGVPVAAGKTGQARASSCASPIRLFRSAASTAATTCGKSLSECVGARGSGLGLAKSLPDVLRTQRGTSSPEPRAPSPDTTLSALGLLC